jgi:hypothetical protein
MPNRSRTHTCWEYAWSFRAIQVDGNDKSTGQINTGIGLVIPAKHILTALELPPVAEGRKLVVERLRKSSNVKVDKAVAPFVTPEADC